MTEVRIVQECSKGTGPGCEGQSPGRDCLWGHRPAGRLAAATLGSQKAPAGQGGRYILQEGLLSCTLLMADEAGALSTSSFFSTTWWQEIFLPYEVVHETDDRAPSPVLACTEER